MEGIYTEARKKCLPELDNAGTLYTWNYGIFYGV